MRHASFNGHVGLLECSKGMFCSSAGVVETELGSVGLERVGSTAF